MNLKVVKVSLSFNVMTQPLSTVFVCFSASGPQLCTWDPVCQRRGVLVTVAARCVEYTCHIIFTWFTYRGAILQQVETSPCFQESDYVCDEMSQLTPSTRGLQGRCSKVEELALSSDWWVFLHFSYTPAVYVHVHTWRKTFVVHIYQINRDRM